MSKKQAGKAEEKRWHGRIGRWTQKNGVGGKSGPDPTPWWEYLELGFSPWPPSDILAYMQHMGYYHTQGGDGLFTPLDPNSLTPGLLASIDFYRQELTAMAYPPKSTKEAQQLTLELG